MKIFLDSFSRASNGAISLIRKKLIEKDIITDSIEDANYIMAVGDRWETFDFALTHWRAGKQIIHLWAGECSPGSWDEVARHSMTLMSSLQLCTNEHAKNRVEKLFEVSGEKANAVVVGNVMMENMEVDESILEKANLKPQGYDLILYNPLFKYIKEDLKQIIQELMYEVSIKGTEKQMGNFPFVWIKPNSDRGYEYIQQYATTATQPRPKFLALLKNCRRFITNSSSMYYEAPFLLKKEQIIPIGVRNAERESKYAKMDIPNASENIIKALEELEKTKTQREQDF